MTNSYLNEPTTVSVHRTKSEILARSPQPGLSRDLCGSRSRLGQTKDIESRRQRIEEIGLSVNPKKTRSKWRLRALVSVAVITLMVVFYYREYKFARPVGSGPAGPVVAVEPFESVWNERAVHVLGIGDSITAGLGARSESHRYFNQVIENPTDATVRSAN